MSRHKYPSPRSGVRPPSPAPCRRLQNPVSKSRPSPRAVAPPLSTMPHSHLLIEQVLAGERGLDGFGMKLSCSDWSVTFRAGTSETLGIALRIILRTCCTIGSGVCLVVLRTTYGGNGGTVRSTGNWGMASMENPDLDYTRSDTT